MSSTGAEDPPTQVVVPGGQGVQVGDHGTQDNKYIQTNIETLVIQPPAAPLAGPVVAGSRLPGSARRVWNIPARNPGFTGRDDLLEAVRERLVAGDRAVVQALHGMGGVGKTQLAAEYAHRFAESYDLAWWVNSEQGGLIGDQFAALGVALGCVQAGTGTEVVRAVVLAELRERGRWLVVFDNAENPADVTPWLPGGGHVLITTRASGWAEVAAPVEVDVLTRAESVAILQTRVDGLAGVDADRLADELGDLPLAVAQAAGFMAETGMAAAEYLDLLHTQAGQLLSQGVPGSYPRSLAAATQLAVNRLAGEDPPAAELASLCAFMAAEPIPNDLFTSAASILPADLAVRVANPLAWRQTLAHLTRQSLARVDHHGLQMHRLTQAILRDRLTSEQAAAAARARTEAILSISDPGSSDDPATWPAWARLLPHLLAADLRATTNSDLRQLACDASGYLVLRGDARTAYDLTTRVFQPWRHRLGCDDPHTWSIGDSLAWALRLMRRYAEARELDQDILARRRRVLGKDHPDSLWSACHLALDLLRMGEVQAARDLDQDTLARCRRVLGDDHVTTVTLFVNLAADLRDLGEVQAARDLDQDALARCHRILGDNHPYTLESASSLAADLRAMGEVQAARDLDQDTLVRRRQVLGEDDRLTLISASNLAADLRAMGEIQAARDLDQDTLVRRRQVLGEDHPDTLASASNLAADLRAMGEC